MPETTYVPKKPNMFNDNYKVPKDNPLDSVEFTEGLYRWGRTVVVKIEAPYKGKTFRHAIGWEGCEESERSEKSKHLKEELYKMAVEELVGEQNV